MLQGQPQHQRILVSLEISVQIYQGKPQHQGHQSHLKSVYTLTRATTESTALCLIGNPAPHISRATTESMAISLTGNQCPNITTQTDLNSYQSHWKSVSTYNQCKHRSTAMCLTGNQCTHITRGTTDLQLCLTGNQSPHMTGATTESTTISVTGNSVHMYQGQQQVKGYPSHRK